MTNFDRCREEWRNMLEGGYWIGPIVFCIYPDPARSRNT